MSSALSVLYLIFWSFQNNKTSSLINFILNWFKSDFELIELSSDVYRDAEERKSEARRRRYAQMYCERSER